MELQQGDQVGLIACSDGRKLEQQDQIERIKQLFARWGLGTVEAETIYRQEGTYWSGSPALRAQELTKLYKNPKIKAIFDLSGGDSANQVLPYLDFDTIKQHIKPLFGYSDVTVLLNSLYSQVCVPVYHYQIMHLGSNKDNLQERSLYNLLFNAREALSFDYDWIQGDVLSGQIVGGNIRCFLKLAGTPYIPDPEGKVLFLESLSGKSNRIATFLAQFEQIGYFNKMNGLILGTFTELEQTSGREALVELIEPYAQKYHWPIIKSNQLGHGSNSPILKIGQHLTLKKQI
ncbi:S66 peptidase family protein [Amphibacillus cookii]|uniref:S66 peptidase family protein n=1 Tax=Amphibacillus cookii TaxID=767787 RepID=UPI0019569C6E|nr:LD-carboxypeptidase [Amphibacillus cookii]MBM7542076.1 muramoyltetrapeptide carboxypeptidase LdcA involved in peptidoglycan recycling [Amphibacillus cookii]